MTEVREGDCVELMRAMPDASVDAIVTDPPYGLGFMGREWDGLPPGDDFAVEALRVLKPGGHLLAFGGTRTYHRLACAVEDAGFEIRDTIAWLYGSGFPKSLDVSKAIDATAGAAREVVGQQPDRWTQKGGVLNFATDRPQESVPITGAPATPEAEQWSGWGTALKPAHEPIVVARKPLAGTVAGNVLEHGTGALNVDGCRIEGPPRTTHADGHRSSGSGEGFGMAAYEALVPGGRWPANVALDPEAADLLDEQTGELVSGTWNGERSAPKTQNAYGDFALRAEAGTSGDRGGASRFFYVAKAGRTERNAGLQGFEESDPPGSKRSTPAPGRASALGSPRANGHPTVKPIALMRWLVRLVTPPGGTVLDPFTGSGTTGCACALEGFDFIGMEREPEYAQIARARIAYWTDPQPHDLEVAEAEARARDAEIGQETLDFGEAA